MGNNNKTGKAILDSHIKAVKKLTKSMNIKPQQNDGYYLDSDLNDAVFRIKSVRKYKHRRTIWSDNKEQYVYEIDVIVDVKTDGWFRSNLYCQRYARRYNNYYRSCILGATTNELKYFGIDKDCDITISKIEYRSIV
jgi:hypothetical protein